MTTNHPEKLDEALIRPGRVDHQVAFTNATRYQIKEVFERMYSKDPPREKLIATTSPATSPVTNIQIPTQKAEKMTPLLPKHPSTQEAPKNTINPPQKIEEKRPLTPPDTPITVESETQTEPINISPVEKKITIADVEKNGELEILKEGELSVLATQFSERIEDFEFSPAEVQGFLLTRKKAPRKAVAEIDAWVTAQRKSKVEGVKF